jgi:hypothetical protein
MLDASLEMNGNHMRPLDYLATHPLLRFDALPSSTIRLQRSTPSGDRARFG